MSFNVVVPSHVDRCYVDNCPTVVGKYGDFCEDHENFDYKCVSCGGLTTRTCSYHMVENSFERCDKAICNDCTHTNYPNLKRIKTHDKKENLEKAKIHFRTIEGFPVRFGEKVYHIYESPFGFVRMTLIWKPGYLKFTNAIYFSKKENAKEYQRNHLKSCEYCKKEHLINGDQHKNLTLERICNISLESWQKRGSK